MRPACGGCVAKKRKNPNDATFRNITALKKRVKALEDMVESMNVALKILWKRSHKVA